MYNPSRKKWQQGDFNIEVMQQMMQQLQEQKKITVVKENTRELWEKLTAMETMQSSFKEGTKEGIHENITQVVDKITETNAKISTLEGKVQETLHKQAVSSRPSIRILKIYGINVRKKLQKQATRWNTMKIK